MVVMQFIPGAVTTDSIKGIILSRGGGTPAVQIAPAGTNKPAVPANVTQTRGTQKFAQAMRAEGLLLFSLRRQGLKPETQYELTATQDGKQQSITFKTLPVAIPRAGVTLVVASCFYDNDFRARKYLRSLKKAGRHFNEPLLKLLVGDNLYLDGDPVEAITGKGDYRETVATYAKYFLDSRYAGVLGCLPNFTTWDDHEFWNNFPERQGHLARSKGQNRQECIEASQECIRHFQASLNPNPVSRAAGGLSYRFDVGSLSFFVADTRSRRTTHRPVRDRRMMLDEDMAALERWAGRLQGPGILVLGQPLWLSRGTSTDYVPRDFEPQYSRIWNALQSAPFDIMVISGDIHHSRLVQFGTGPRAVHEFVSSPASHVVLGEPPREIGLPDAIPLDKGVTGYTTLELRRYMMGAGDHSTFGLLNFKPGAGGTVTVDCGFIKADADKPSRCLKASTPTRNLFPAPWDRKECLYRDAFTLGPH